MNHIKVTQKDTKFGILENGSITIPLTHSTKESAISEWKHFEELNISFEYHNFLGRMLNTAIEKVVSKLREFNTFTEEN